MRARWRIERAVSSYPGLVKNTKCIPTLRLEKTRLVESTFPAPALTFLFVSPLSQPNRTTGECVTSVFSTHLTKLFPLFSPGSWNPMNLSLLSQTPFPLARLSAGLQKEMPPPFFKIPSCLVLLSWYFSYFTWHYCTICTSLLAFFCRTKTLGIGIIS